MLAAVSGGPDSMALLDLLCLLREDLDIEIGVAHLNHGLRGRESDDDQKFVRQAARRPGLSFYTQAVDVPRLARRRGLSLETAAREARRCFLQSVAVKHGFGKIATGHTLSDQAETVLMHLIRGVGSDGLGGIPAQNGKFIRPLLRMSRREVMEHLARRGVAYRTDSTNLKPDAFRNRVRLELLPLLAKYNPKIEESLARTAEALAGDRELLAQVSDEAAERCVKAAKSILSIDLDILKGYNKGLKRNIIRWCCQRLLGPGRTPDFESTERALRLAEAGRVGQRTSLVGDLWAQRGYGRLLITEGLAGGPDRVAPSKKISSRGTVSWEGWSINSSIVPGYRVKSRAASPSVAYFDLDRLCLPALRVAPTRPGLRMKLFGSGGTRKIQDILVDAKIPRRERGFWPVIYQGDQPIWLAGIRRSNAALVTGKTRRILRMEMVRNGR